MSETVTQGVLQAQTVCGVSPNHAPFCSCPVATLSQGISQADVIVPFSGNTLELSCCRGPAPRILASCSSPALVPSLPSVLPGRHHCSPRRHSRRAAELSGRGATGSQASCKPARPGGAAGPVASVLHAVGLWMVGLGQARGDPPFWLTTSGRLPAQTHTPYYVGSGSKGRKGAGPGWERGPGRCGGPGDLLPPAPNCPLPSSLLELSKAHPPPLHLL